MTLQGMGFADFRFVFAQFLPPFPKNLAWCRKLLNPAFYPVDHGLIVPVHYDNIWWKQSNNRWQDNIQKGGTTRQVSILSTQDHFKAKIDMVHK